MLSHWLIGCLLTTALLGCGVEYPCANPIEAWGYEGKNCFVDPPFEVELVKIDPVQGDPYVELGFFKEQLYVPMADGADWPLAKQSQGGVWAHPAIRISGIGSPAVVDCHCVVETGEEIGRVKVKQKFYLATDGFYEIQTFPIPAREPPDDLYGLDGTVECTVEDKVGRGTTVSYDVHIIKG